MTVTPGSIVVVGQPAGLASGQAAMIGALLGAAYPDIRLVQVAMRFSSDMSEIGKPSARKLRMLLGLVGTLQRTASDERRRGYRPILYYPPAGPHLAPVIRDLILLGLCRGHFAGTVFHFHAAGLGRFRGRLPSPLRPFFDRAYAAPTVAIVTAESGRSDGEALGAREIVVVPNGVPDVATQVARTRISDVPRILFVGLLVEDKGIFVMLEALVRLAVAGRRFEAVFVGHAHSEAVLRRAQALARSGNIEGRISFAGELHGEALLQAYADADLFCFPSFFAAESFGLVCIEAMRASLPVVATDWRGIPEVVAHEKTGLIVPPRNAGALAGALARLLDDPALRTRFGQAGRQAFLDRFTVEQFRERMDGIFHPLVAPTASASNVS